MLEIVAFRDEGLGNASYLVDLGDGRGLVLDPSRDPAAHLAAAERRGLRLVWTVETHLHADFVSGSRELAAAGATVVAPAAAGLEFPHRGLGDGEELDLGGLSLRALATPGHTPEHLAYVLADGGRPLALFSGGSLLVGAVARTDLISPDRTEELARALWRSLRERVLTLPDDLAVYPTHGSGSFCSAPTGAEPTTTIGREKATNPLLAAADEDAFVNLLLDGLGSYPRYFLRLRETNRRGPRIYGATPPPLAPLSPEQVRRQVDDGAELVDARPVAAFAAGHVPGALSIPLRSAFATWLGWLVLYDRPLVVVLDPDQDHDDLVRRCLKIGYERLAGELAGGMAAWRSAGLPEARIGIAGVADQAGGTVLDVRQRAEFTSGHLPGAHHVELGALASAGALPAGPLAVMCGHGERAMTGASLLQRAGRRDLTVLVGGASDWSAATGRPLETP
ncbi:MAG TPA: rhodanese-like domain-containing protein [Actinomycetota bacterium]|jgi:glyoxylase-like metal-dependent hydrolase (beta-lactamase superfamily II)|nr:rhodanese-like domain-containing protein [Actinomycetota bacterium]